MSQKTLLLSVSCAGLLYRVIKQPIQFWVEKGLHPLIGDGEFLSRRVGCVSLGGGGTVLDPQFSYFVALPLMNARSLISPV